VKTEWECCFLDVFVHTFLGVTLAVCPKNLPQTFQPSAFRYRRDTTHPWTCTGVHQMPDGTLTANGNVVEFLDVLEGFRHAGAEHLVYAGSSDSS